MRNVIKVWSRIVIIISVFVAVFAFIFAKNASAKIVAGIILALRFTLFSITTVSLDTRKKSITLGVLDTIFYFPVVGILYLIWIPRNGEVYL